VLIRTRRRRLLCPVLLTCAARRFAARVTGLASAVPIEHISRPAGHSSTATTETTYGKQIRPVIVPGADIMDRIFPGGQIPKA
jgi:hypothetical protein